MSAAVRIPLFAVAAESEHPALTRAAAVLSTALSEAAGMQVMADLVFRAALSEITAADQAAIVIASLLAEIDDVQSWPDAEARLRTTFVAAQEAGLNLFVLTILRHVKPADGASNIREKRIRLARLNLFAADISRETGCSVIDIDRALADIGAYALQTDYRLGGDYGAEAAARCIATTILALGLDDYVPYAAQEKARAAIIALPLPWQHRLSLQPEMINHSMMALGTGRRQQRASMVIHAVEGNHIAMLLRAVLTRQMTISDAAAKFRRAMSTRGLGATMRAAFSGIVKLVRNRVKAVTS